MTKSSKNMPDARPKVNSTSKPKRRPRTTASRDPYIDVLPPAELRVVANALEDALREKRKSVWPATLRSGSLSAPPSKDEDRKVATDVDPQQVLVPLARLGAAQGNGGSSVFVAYFKDQGGRYLPSRPLVVKIGSHEGLDDELTRAKSWPPHAHGEDSSFACPWRLFPVKPGKPPIRSVLIAPFSSVDALDSERNSYALDINDLWRVLTDKSTDRDPSDVLRGVYELLHGIHRHGRVECERRTLKYSTAYGLYLRKLHTTKRKMVESLFGTKETTRLLGHTWPNPVHIVDQLVPMAFEGAAGPIHGDLHPKNVVLDRSGRPRIIDFGWAVPRGHVVVDYVLMEVNLRALTLSAQVSHEDAIALARMLDDDDPIPHAAKAVIARATLIRETLWTSARHSGVSRDWIKEYLVPQFLVAFGLLKFLDNARNQHALLATVLALGSRITASGVIKPKSRTAQ